MKIILKELRLHYFKGITKLILTDLDKHQINIYGQNATGKTTVADAWHWLWFHKDSSGRSDFEIKTLDKSNNAITGAQHSVSAVILIDGNDHELKKVYQEKWVVTNGVIEERFAGHETTYYINNVPSTKKAYDEWIDSLLSIDVLKAISNITYFNTALAWDKRREMLFNLAGKMSDDDIIDQNTDLEPLRGILKKYKLDDYKYALNSEITKIEKDMSSIPARIDEVNRAMPSEVDVETVTGEILDKQARLDSIDTSLTDLSAQFEHQQKIQAEVFQLKTQQHKLENEAILAAHDKNRELKNTIHDIQHRIKLAKKKEADLRDLRTKNELEIDAAKAQQEQLRLEFFQKKSESLTITETLTCPTCKRPLADDDVYVQQKINEMKDNFKQSLDQINVNGQKLTQIIQSLTNSLASIDDEIEQLQPVLLEGGTVLNLEKQLKECTPKIDEDAFNDLQKRIDEKSIQLQKPQMNHEALVAKKKKLLAEISALKDLLAYQEIRGRALERIKELKAEKEQLVLAKAKRQQGQKLCELFLKTKVECLEASVNSKFKYINYKLFRKQVNGGREECCEALITGVPYSSANNAAKINAGLDVINAISQWKGVTAPVFIDSRESVNEIIDTDSQIINLYVTDTDDNLRVEARETRNAKDAHSNTSQKAIAENKILFSQAIETSTEKDAQSPLPQQVEPVQQSNSVPFDLAQEALGGMVPDF